MGKHLIGILILSLALLLPGRYTPCIESKPLHLAMILSCGETEAEQGFKDRLQELGYTVYSTVLNAEQDHKKLGVLLHELIPKLESFDYIYTFGTTVSSTPRVSVNNRVPQMLHVVSDPVDAGIVQSMRVGASGSTLYRLQRLDDHGPGLRTLSARLDATHTFDFDAKRSRPRLLDRGLTFGLALNGREPSGKVPVHCLEPRTVEPSLSNRPLYCPMHPATVSVAQAQDAYGPGCVGQPGGLVS